MDCQKNTTHIVIHEKRTIQHKTNNDWKINWNNVLFTVYGFYAQF